jgi:hypothetical protein
MGTPACGKSTVSRALASRFKLGLHIPVDDLRHMVVGGLSDMNFSNEATAKVTGEQIRLARVAASQMARTYNSAGFAVAIDDFGFNHIPGTPFHMGFNTVPETHYDLGSQADKIVLLLSFETTLQRLYGRNGSENDFAKMLENANRLSHPIIAEHPKPGWIVVNSTHLTVE